MKRTHHHFCDILTKVTWPASNLKGTADLPKLRYPVLIQGYWSVVFKSRMTVKSKGRKENCFFCFFFFFYFTIFYWFCHISKWIHHRYTSVPHPEPFSLLPPHTISLGHPSAPAPSIQNRASNLDWQLISYMIFYMFQCHSPKSSHPLPLPQSP